MNLYIYIYICTASTEQAGVEVSKLTGSFKWSLLASDNMGLEGPWAQAKVSRVESTNICTLLHSAPVFCHVPKAQLKNSCCL